MKAKQLEFKTPATIGVQGDVAIAHGVIIKPVVTIGVDGEHSLINLVFKPTNEVGQESEGYIGMDIKDVPDLLKSIREMLTPMEKLEMLKSSMTALALGETIAEISILIGDTIYEKIGCRATTNSEIVQMAFEFETLHAGFDWGIDEELPDGKPVPYCTDYYEAIETFVSHKLKEYGR
jgi:hypothetical protein